MAKNAQARDLGISGEATVIEYLQNQGFKIVAQNFRTKSGELDIVAEDAHTRAFIEVKARQCAYFNLSEVVTYKKQQAIIRTALYFNQLHGWPQDKNTRFDVALLQKNRSSFAIEYIPNAFSSQMESMI